MVGVGIATVLHGGDASPTRWRSALGATITDVQRIAHLEEKVEFLGLCVTDLRRSVEALHTLIDEIRLEQIHLAVRAGTRPADARE